METPANNFEICMLIIEAMQILKGKKVDPFPDPLVKIQRRYMLDYL